jgi:hypothetical protein
VDSSTVPLNARPGTLNASRSAAPLGVGRLPVTLRQLVQRIPESLRAGRGQSPGREFQLCRTWVVAILCGLFGLSLVLVVLAVAGSHAPAPAPLTVGTGPGPATSSAPPSDPPSAAPPTPAGRSEAEAPAQRSKAPARSAGGSAASSDDSDDSADDDESADSDSPSEPDFQNEWAPRQRGYDMARDMMRYRMNSRVHPHP